MKTDFLNKITKIFLRSNFLLAAFFLFTLTAQAHTIPTPTCPFTAQEGRTIIDMGGESFLRSDSTEADAASSVFPVSIQAGHYEVSLVSFDGHTTQRVNDTQPNESWYLILKDGLSEVAQSLPISDLEDGVASAFLTEIVNTNLNIPTDIDSVMAFHAVYPDESSPNSVVPVCAAFDLIPDSPSLKGSISICKAIIDDNSDFIDSLSIVSTPATSFDIPLLKGDTYLSATDISTASFNLDSFSPNTDIFSNDAVDDSECILFDNLDITSYFYEVEEISSEANWETPLYNDQYSSSISSLANFFSYSEELFNSDPADDSTRNLNSDGQIILTENRPDRVLVVLNQKFYIFHLTK